MTEIKFFGHSFFQITHEKSVLVDPFISSCSKHLKRLIPCSAKNSEFRNISHILISHEHPDHFDKTFVEEIASKNDSLVIAHDFLLNELSLPKRQLVPIMTEKPVTARNVTVKAVSAHHPRAFYPLSFLIEVNGSKIFHAGDTDLLEEHERVKADVALLPIGGPCNLMDLSTMDVIDAVKATKCIKPKYVVPMHYNTFECIKADPLEFKRRIEKSNLKTKAVIMQPGETLSL